MDGTVTDGRLLAGRYRIGSLLGEGGMAGVYEGYDTRLARPVAIKVLRASVAAHDSMRRRFEREARSAAGLSNPHVVAIYDTGEDDGVAYLVMERLPGVTLADRIAEGPLPASRVVTMAEDVLAALDAAHAIGLVHRDIKPGNILLTDGNRAKVADFGIAKSMEAPADDPTVADLTHPGLVIGTPAYLAPERIAGRPATSHSDLYALGVVMYEALAGHKPIAGDSPAAMAEARRVRPPLALSHAAPDTPAWLIAVVNKALAPEVHDRYPSARAMLEDLRARGTATPGGALTTMDHTQVAGSTAVLGDGWDHDAARVPTAEQPVVGAGAPRSAEGRWPSWLRWLAVALAVVVVAAVVLTLVLLLGGGHQNRRATTAPTTRSPTTTAPATTGTTRDPTATALVQEAQRLQAVGGSGRNSLAQQLLGVAAQPVGAQRAQAAQTTLYDARIFAQRGDITPSEYALVSSLLQQAGATAIAPPSSATTTIPPRTPATTTPTTTPPTTPPTTPAPTAPAVPPTPASPPTTAPARGHGPGHGHGAGGGHG